LAKFLNDVVTLIDDDE